MSTKSAVCFRRVARLRRRIVGAMDARNDAMKDQVVERARNAIESALRDQYADSALSVLALGSEVDGDGDEFLWVRLVYDGAPGTLDTDTTIKLNRFLRSKLEEAEVAASPVLSFVDRSDLDFAV